MLAIPYCDEDDSIMVYNIDTYDGAVHQHGYMDISRESWQYLEEDTVV